MKVFGYCYIAAPDKTAAASMIRSISCRVSSVRWDNIKRWDNINRRHFSPRTRCNVSDHDLRKRGLVRSVGCNATLGGTSDSLAPAACQGSYLSKKGPVRLK